MKTLKKYYLEDDFFVTKTNREWTLHYEKELEELNEKGNKKISRDIWHCSNPKICLKIYKNQSLTPCNDADTIINRLDEVDENIEKFYKELLIGKDLT